MARIFFGEFAATSLKMFATCVYSAWAIKIGLFSNMNPLFAIAMIGLSIYGLWVVVSRVAERIVQLTSQGSEGRTQ